MLISICQQLAMEDAHTMLLDIEDAKGTAFFAVYDGHGGTLPTFGCVLDSKVAH